MSIGLLPRATGLIIRFWRRFHELSSTVRNAPINARAGQDSQRFPAGGGMFGLLVSSNAPRGRWS
jgi:hypothetical protein